MSDSFLFASQKARIAKVISDHNLEPTDFDWIQLELAIGDETAFQRFKIFRIASEYYFQFTLWRDSHLVGEIEFFPGFGSFVGNTNDNVTWDTTYALINTWVGRVNEEVLAIDPWLTSKAPLLLHSPSTNIDNSNFDSSELSAIKDAIDDLKSFIAERTQIVKEELDGINSKLDYLVDSAKRQGKQDWYHTTVGVVAGTVASHPQTQAFAGEIMRKALELVVPILQHGVKALP